MLPSPLFSVPATSAVRGARTLSEKGRHIVPSFSERRVPREEPRGAFGSSLCNARRQEKQAASRSRSIATPHLFPVVPDHRPSVTEVKTARP